MRDRQDRLRHELDRFDSRDGKLLVWLKRINADAARGVEWLRENQDLFEKEVFGPAMLCCSVTDERYSDAVQASLRRDDFLCFTVQTNADFDLLNRKFYDELNLSVAMRTCMATRDQFRPPLDAVSAREHGFDGFAIDFVDGPAPVLAMLCAEAKLHATGVALEDITSEQYQRIYDGERVSRWVTGRQSYRITRRRDLGPHAVSTTTRPVRPGQFWKEPSVDPGERARVQTALERVEGEFGELKQQNGDLLAKVEQLQQRQGDILQEIVR